MTSRREWIKYKVQQELKKKFASKFYKAADWWRAARAKFHILTFLSAVMACWQYNNSCVSPFAARGRKPLRIITRTISGLPLGTQLSRHTYAPEQTAHYDVLNFKPLSDILTGREQKSFFGGGSIIQISLPANLIGPRGCALSRDINLISKHPRIFMVPLGPISARKGTTINKIIEIFGRSIFGEGTEMLIGAKFVYHLVHYGLST